MKNFKSDYRNISVAQVKKPDCPPLYEHIVKDPITKSRRIICTNEDYGAMYKTGRNYNPKKRNGIE